MQRILSLYDWQVINSGEQAVVHSDIPDQRAVRLRVNVSQPTALYLEVEDLAEPVFLAYVSGLDEIQFNIVGGYKLFAIGGDVYFDTQDGTRADVEPVDQTSFTTIVERQQQSPEILLMERKMQENIERRMALMYQTFDTALQQKDAALEAARTAAAAASATASEPNAGSVPSGEPAAEASGATGGGSDGK